MKFGLSFLHVNNQQPNDNIVGGYEVDTLYRLQG